MSAKKSGSKKFSDVIHLDGAEIRFHDSYDFLGWKNAFDSKKIDSVMSTWAPSEVGRENTFTCFCSGYHGLPDNKLKLAVLYQDDVPIARAITFKKGRWRCYTDCYGDKRLLNWLKSSDYSEADYPVGTILYTDGSYLKPYIGGKVYRSDHHHIQEGFSCIHYWKLSKYGVYSLCSPKARAHRLTQCECCGGYFDEDRFEIDSSYSSADEQYHYACDDCFFEKYSFPVYCGEDEPERLFFHNGEFPNTHNQYSHTVYYEGRYYLREALYKYKLAEAKGAVYPIRDLYYCDITGDYFPDRDDMIFSAEDIGVNQAVFFPYDCVSREYWDENVVECACGTLALREDTRVIGDDEFGRVTVLDKYWRYYTDKNEKGWFTVSVFKLPDIEEAYKHNPSDKMRALLDFARAYNEVMYSKV